MAIIPWPVCAFITSIAWTLDQPAQINKSQWTGRRQVTILPVAAQWSAKITFEVKVSDDDALAVEALIVDLQGPANTFRLPVSEQPQFAYAMPIKVNGAGQYGYNLNIKNGPVGAILKRGHKLTIADQLVMVMADATIGPLGTASLSIKPALRISPTDGALIEAVNPTCLVAMSSTSAGWQRDYPSVHSFSLDVEEVFA